MFFILNMIKVLIMFKINKFTEMRFSVLGVVLEMNRGCVSGIGHGFVKTARKRVFGKVKNVLIKSVN